MAQLMKSIWKHLPALEVGFMAVLLLVFEIIFYNHPTFGFAVFGPAVFIPTIFPLIWGVLYIIGDRAKPKTSQNDKVKNNVTPGEGK